MGRRKAPEVTPEEVIIRFFTTATPEAQQVLFNVIKGLMSQPAPQIEVRTRKPKEIKPDASKPTEG